MKKFFLGLLLISTMANAEVSSLVVRNFNFDYVNPHGAGSAEAFGTGNSGSSVDVSVDRIDREFKISVTGADLTEYEFKNAPDFLVDANSIAVNGLNLNLTDKLIFSLNSGIFESLKDGISMYGLSLDSHRDFSQKEIFDQLLLGATQRLSLKLTKFTSTDSSFFVEEVVGSNVVVSSLDLKINNKKFDLSADLRAQVSGKVKASGQMSYESTQGLLTLKISEVKFGFLNITSKVFDELKKNESPRMKVKEPYVYYQLK